MIGSAEVAEGGIYLNVFKNEYAPALHDCQEVFERVQEAKRCPTKCPICALNEEFQKTSFTPQCIQWVDP